MKTLSPTSLLLIIGHALCHMFIALLPILAISLQTSLNMPFSLSLYGIMVSTCMFGLGSLPAGWLADRGYAKPLMAVFFIGSAVFSLLAGLATNAYMLIFWLGCLGLTASIYHPISTLMILETATNKGRALAINSWAGNIGVSLTALLAGLALNFGSWRISYISLSLISLLCGLLFLMYNKMSLTKPQTSKSPAEHNRKTSLKEVITQKSQLVLLIAIMGTGFLHTGFSVATPKLFFENLPQQLALSEGMIANLISLAYFIASLAHLLGGYLINRYSGKKIYTYIYFLMTPLIILAMYAQSYMLVAIMSLCMFLHTSSSGAEKILIFESAQDNMRATVMGLRFMLGVVIGAIGAPIIGFIHDYFHSSLSILWLIATVSIIVFLTSFNIRNDAKQEQHS